MIYFWDFQYTKTAAIHYIDPAIANKTTPRNNQLQLDNNAIMEKNVTQYNNTKYNGKSVLLKMYL